MNYTNDLEKQNEELSQKLAKSESVVSIWEPEWVFMPGYDDKLSEFWHLTNGFFIHATIKHTLVDGYFHVTLMNSKNIEYVTSTLESAKQSAMLGLMRKRSIRDTNKVLHRG